jgi:hypothetical protein
MLKTNKLFIDGLIKHLELKSKSRKVIEGVTLLENGIDIPKNFFKIKLLNQEFEIRLYKSRRNNPDSSNINIWAPNRAAGRNSFIQFTLNTTNYLISDNEFSIIYNRGITIGTGQEGLREEYNNLIIKNGLNKDRIIITGSLRNTDFDKIMKDFFKWIRISVSAKLELEKKYRNENQESANEEFINETLSKTEGGKKVVISIQSERDSTLRKSAIKIHGKNRKVCGFNFESKYGSWGADYIEVHHVTPLNENKKKSVVTNPKTDLTVVCANCHRMIHKKKGITLTIEELQKKMKITNKGA